MAIVAKNQASITLIAPLLFFLPSIAPSQTASPPTTILALPLMDAGRKTKTYIVDENAPSLPNLATSLPVRNLKKSELGGVICGCKDNTMEECLSKQLFGLPAQHFLYVKNIDPGLPLFLFNYTDRKLHGVFEAASYGQLNIDPYAWTTDGSERTPYPAQVQIHVRVHCQPLLEKQFAPIIKDNYYSRNHFWFELDHTQASKLMSMLSSQVIVPGASIVQNTAIWRVVTQPQSSHKTEEHEEIKSLVSGNSGILGTSQCQDGAHRPLGGGLKEVDKDEYELIYDKLKKLVANNENAEIPSASQVQESFNVDEPHKADIGSQIAINKENSEISSMNLVQESANINEIRKANSGSSMAEMFQQDNEDGPLLFSDSPSLIAQLIQEVKELKAFRKEQIEKMGLLEQKLINSEIEIKQLREHCMMLESLCSHSDACDKGAMIEPYVEQQLDLKDIVFLVGGFDGQSCLSSLESYSPSRDIIKSLRPMSSVRAYTPVTSLNDHLYVVGGGNGSLWYDTVEFYNPQSDDWRSLPSLNERKGSLAAVAFNDKIFAIGGGNGVDCFQDVEMFDADVGRWISARSMLQKRFALAAVELNGAFYAVGGYDGNDYLRSAERFDPREHSWTRIDGMNSKRGSHSLVVLNEKLYALGGFDGSTIVPTVEVYDPRHGTWTTEGPMNSSRGYFAAAVLKGSLYVIGGVDDNQKIIETVERYEEGRGWQVTDLKAIGKRCFSSAIVL